MPSLGSIILQRDEATAPVVEEALGRQVLYGGDLATNLLELRALSEARVHELQAESLGMSAAPAGRIARSSAEVRGRVPADIADRHGVYPLELSAECLVLAVSSPLPAAVIGELETTSGRKVVQQAALAIRIHEALVRDYATSPNRRFDRLCAVLAGEPDPFPTLPPFKDGSVPVGAPPLGEPPTPRASVDAPPLPQAVAAESKPSLPASGHAGGARSGDPSSGRTSWRPKRRGPYTAADAEADLLNAAERDDIVGAFFAFSSQYFEYSALFAVHGDIAEGRDAQGPGADRKRVATIGVHLDLSSILRQPWRSGQWQLAVLSGEGLNGNLARDLERGTGKVVAVVPVVVRGRTVMLLYGDHGESDVELGQIGDIIAFAPLVARSLERLLVQRKLVLQGRSLSGSLPAPPFGGTGPESERSQVRDGGHVGVVQEPSPPIDREAVEKARLDLVDSLSGARIPRAVASESESRPPPPVGAVSSLVQSECPEVDSGAATASAQAPRVSGEGIEPDLCEGVPPVHPTKAFPFRVPHVPNMGGTSELVPPGGARQEQGVSIGTGPSDVSWGGASSVRPAIVRELVAPMRFGVEPTPPDADAGRGVERANDTTPQHAATIGSSATAVSLPRGGSADELPYFVEQLLEGDRSALDPIVAMGEGALGYLIFHFPGPIHEEILRPGAKRASECGLLLEAIVRIGYASVPFVAVRTADAQPDVRRWATLVLAELPAPESVRAILSRLGDREGIVRQAAAAGARLLLSHSGGRHLVQSALRDMVAPERDKSTRLTAFEYLAEVRHPLVVPILLDTLRDPDRDMARSAEWALGVLCRQSFGMDLGAWTDWWEDNRFRERPEWLMDSLTHPLPAIRRAAAEELRILTGQTFGYRDDLPAVELARAQSSFREWWSQRGAS